MSNTKHNPNLFKNNILEPFYKGLFLFSKVIVLFLLIFNLVLFSISVQAVDQQNVQQVSPSGNYLNLGDCAGRNIASGEVGPCNSKKNDDKIFVYS